MKKQKIIGCFVGLTIVLSMVGLASAADRERRGPPPEAIAACEDKAEGDACSVEFRGRTIDGKCVSGPSDDDALVCMPAGGRPPEPPPEAVEACEGARRGRLLRGRNARAHRDWDVSPKARRQRGFAVLAGPTASARMSARRS